MCWELRRKYRLINLALVADTKMEIKFLSVATCCRKVDCGACNNGSVIYPFLESELMQMPVDLAACL